MRALLVLAVVSCKAADQKAVDDYLVKAATESIAQLEEILAAKGGKHSLDWGMVTRCADMANIDAIEKLNRPVATQLRQLCTKDVPLAMMNHETALAEAAIKADPKSEFVPECHSPTFNFAKDQMTEAKTVDLAKDVIARFEATCHNDLRK